MVPHRPSPIRAAQPGAVPNAKARQAKRAVAAERAAATKHAVAAKRAVATERAGPLRGVLPLICAALALGVLLGGCVGRRPGASTGSSASNASGTAETSARVSGTSLPGTSAAPTSADGAKSSAPAVSSFPAPESDPRYVRAYKAYSSGAYDEAESICDAAIRQDASCFWAYNVKGIAHYFANGNRAAAQCLKWIDRSTQINPSYSYGYFNKALIEKGTRDWDASLRDFNRVLQLKPNDTWSYYGIATVYADSDRDDQALQYLKLALDTDPDGVKAQAKDDLNRHFSHLRHDARFQKLTGIS